VLATVVLAAAGWRLTLPRASASPAPPQSIRGAAARSAVGGSASATFTCQVGGLTVLFGTVHEQMRPAPMADLTMTTVDGADRFAVEEIVTGSEVYLKIPGLAPGVGKPWLDVPVPQLAADPALDELYQTNAIPTSAAALVAAATTERRAQSQHVDGVSTRRFVGSIDPATALTRLPPAVRQLLTPELKSASGEISFVAWIDGQDNFRKIQTTATIGGRSTVTTIVFTTTKAAQIVIPVASQVATTPAG
jgi:hypothetical protein